MDAGDLRLFIQGLSKLGGITLFPNQKPPTCKAARAKVEFGSVIVKDSGILVCG
jgi:hypothetical protein